MTTFTNADNLWDMSLPPSLPSLADDEFLALLQKQFDANNDNLNKQQPINIPQTTNIDPAALRSFPHEASPPLSDDSPSPPSARDMSRSRRESGAFGEGNNSQLASADDDNLKRKADEEEDDEDYDGKGSHGPQAKKNGSARRKVGGGSTADESRLLKRKEQNRAAQRAFRERKEKHVKDLEDKVAQLEEKNTIAVAENETLRDLIARLQNENMRLREASFTFSVPSSSGTQMQRDRSASRSTPPNAHEAASNFMSVTPGSASSSATVSSNASPQSLFMSDKSNMDFYSPGAMNLIDPEPQHTATADAMGMDFGFGSVQLQTPYKTIDTPYKTIASNPMFMSFREPTPFAMSEQNGYPNHGMMNNHSQQQQQGSFDFSTGGQPFQAWPEVNFDQTQAFDLTNSLDELFGGAYMGNQGPIDLASYTNAKSPANSMSPISHNNSNKSSPSVTTSNGSSPAAHSDTKGCPKSKAELASIIANDTGSVFTPQFGTPSTVPCSTSSSSAPLPKTRQDDSQNVEVLSAWRSIRARYQDVDINELCSEFTAKAKCDGSKVVLEPAGIASILTKCNEKQTQQQFQHQQMQTQQHMGLVGQQQHL